MSADNRSQASLVLAAPAPAVSAACREPSSPTQPLQPTERQLASALANEPAGFVAIQNRSMDALPERWCKVGWLGCSAAPAHPPALLTQDPADPGSAPSVLSWLDDLSQLTVDDRALFPSFTGGPWRREEYSAFWWKGVG